MTKELLDFFPVLGIKRSSGYLISVGKAQALKPPPATISHKRPPKTAWLGAASDERFSQP